MDLELTGKRVVITGGSKGLGRAIAEAFVSEGAAVSVCGRDASAVTRAAREMSAGHDGTVLADAVDVADEREFRTWLVDAAGRLGGVDVFVPNVSAMAETNTEEDWRRSYEIDLMHTVRGVETLEPFLAASGHGSVVIVGTIQSLMSKASADERAYATMKAATLAYGAQMSQVLGPSGIRVNTVSPGAVMFPGSYWETIREQDPDRYDEVTQNIALRRIATPREISDAVTFLASPRASFITGVNLRLDGGRLVHIDY